MEARLELHLVFLPPEWRQRLPHRGSPVGQVALVTQGTGLPLRGTPQPWDLPSFWGHMAGGNTQSLEPGWGRDEFLSLSLSCLVTQGWVRGEGAMSC